MEHILDLPARESAHRQTVEMPETMTIAMPSFWQWVKAGAAATVGVLITLTVAWVLWMVILVNFTIGLSRAFFR